MTKCKTIGLIAAPELAEEIAINLVDILPEKLAKEFSAEGSWEVEYVVDPLTGAAETIHEIFQEANVYRSHKSWDFIICLTDLPIFQDKKVVTVDINESEQISVISIPAFGYMPVTKNVASTVLYACRQIMNESRVDSPEQVKEEGETIDKLPRKDFPIFPAQQMRLWLKETGDIHTRVCITPNVYGKLRLLFGMTFANNPFQMMASLKNVVAIAFTTGAFGLIFPTMWKLSDVFSNVRLTMIMIASMIGMVLWVSAAHHLWEPLPKNDGRHIRILYNLTTAITLFIAILAYYVVVFILFLITSIVLIPPDYLADSLELESSINVISYIKIAWFASSLSIVAGAIGAGLANDELVRNSTYGYRQQMRYKKVRQDKNNQ